MNRTTTLKDVILLNFLGEDQYSEDLPELTPGISVLNNILNYSKALRVFKTKAIENAHVILN